MSFPEPQVKGAILVGSSVPGAASMTPLPPGADGTLVAADSTTSTGLKYVPRVYSFFIPNDLTTTDNALIGWQPGLGGFVSEVTGQVKTAPAGANITVDINLIDRATGATLQTIGTLTILAGSLQGTVTFGAPVQVLATQALEAAIITVGVAPVGANLTIQVY